MLQKFKFKNWTGLATTRNDDAEKIFQAYLAGTLEKIAGTKMLKNGRSGPVIKVNFNGKNYILKHNLCRRHRFEELFKSFFFGSPVRRIIRGLEPLRERGFDNVADHFLVADRRVFGCVVENLIIMEFLENAREVGKIPDGIKLYGNAVLQILKTLHENGLVHGDVNESNFLLCPSGRIAAIDLQGKCANALQKAADIYWLERLFGIPPEKRNWALKIAEARIKYRNR